MQCIFLYEDTKKAPYLLYEPTAEYYGVQYRSYHLQPLVAGEFPSLRRGGVPIGPSFRFKGYSLKFAGLKILTHIQQAQQDKRSCYLCDDPSEVVENIECTPSSTITCTEWERFNFGETEVSRDIEFINEFIGYYPL